MMSASRTVIRLLKGIESICLERNSSGKDEKSLDRTAGFVGYATAPHTLSSDAHVLSSELRPKVGGLGLKLRVWIGGSL
ncbi:hypothetical protein YC2023_088886 [Brassica napus]